MPNYRKKPIIIEARQFPTDGTPAVAHAIYQWVEKNTLGSFEPLAVIEGREPWPESGATIDPRDGRMVIATLEGGHWVTPGDFIIRGVQGEFYPCKSDIFEATYEPAETTPAHHETPDVAELRRLAENATPGPWDSYRPRPSYRAYAVDQVMPAGHLGEAVATTQDVNAEENAAYIAAASPDVVLGLLDRLAHMTEARDNARAEVERLTGRVELVREWIDHRGVNVGDRDDDYMRGYRDAQRHAVQDAAELRAIVDADTLAHLREVAEVTAR